MQVQVVTQAIGTPGRSRTHRILPIEREMSGVPGMTQPALGVDHRPVGGHPHLQRKTADYFARQQVLERLQNVAAARHPSRCWPCSTTAVGEIYRYVLDAPPNADRKRSARSRTGPSGRPCAWCRASPTW